MRQQKKKKITNQSFIDKYKSFAFTLFGRFFNQTEKKERLGLQLKMANMKFTSAVFLSTIVLSGILITVISLILYLIIFLYIINSDSWILYVLSLTGICAAIGFSFLPLLMRMRIASRKMNLEREIPFSLSELSVLASTGLTPIKIMRHMAQRKTSKTMSNEFKKIIHKIDIEGKDIVTAISETAIESPSEMFRETLWDLSNMIHQGGDLDLYLRQKADNTLDLRRHIQKEFTEKLASYSEMYISLVLVSVLFIGIAAYLMNAFGSTIGPLDSEGLLLLLGFGIIPLACIVVVVLLSTASSKTGE